MRILHIAPFNVAGVPLTFVQAERRLGHDSRLITLGKNPRNYEEDVCLNLPFLTFPGFMLLKRIIGGKKRIAVTNKAPAVTSIPIQWRPNKLEQLLFQLREQSWRSKIAEALKKINIDQIAVIQLDGGIGFYRDGRDIVRFKAQGKKIICCYTGSDLRTRGVIPPIDAIADLNVTVEFDHLTLHPKIFHVFFPFDTERFKPAALKDSSKIYIGHAPTNRAAKGSDKIIAIVRELEKTQPVELVLIEKLPYQQAIEKKAACHIFIDQIGDLGYGINGLESLALGIPTCSCLAPGFENLYPDHPFVVVDEHNLKMHLLALIADPGLRQKKGSAGRKWVRQYHDPLQVVNKIHQLAGIK